MTCSSQHVIDGSICYFAAVFFIGGDDADDHMDNRIFQSNWFKIGSVSSSQKQASDWADVDKL